MKDRYAFKKIIENNILKGSENILKFLYENIESNEFIERLEESWENKVKLTFAIMTLNEERCIKRCIESVESIADEIIVIDTGSTDNTLNIINEFFPNIKVYNHLWQEDFSQIRNLFNVYSTNDWIFQLDADEYLDVNTCEEIKKMICILDNIPIEPKIISPTLINHNFSENIYTNRIYKRRENLMYHGIIHEELRFNNSIKIPYVIISNVFFHDGYKKDIIESKQKYKRNVELLKKMLDIEPDNIRWYYFLARDAWTLNYSKEYIRGILEKGLEYTKSDYLGFEVGILSKLIELNMDSSNSISEYISRAKKISPECMDIYYYELLNEQADTIDRLNSSTRNSLNKVTELNEPFSLINSNGDHLFLSWGWGYFFSRDYNLAFMMWKKIKSDEIVFNLNKELSDIKDAISGYLDSSHTY
ncbi:glycosyltransferase family 2 protein [Clostridium botulinum]|uniref:glycosyltransferase family 2 protein n=1 Tax=Clostridium botulinum TaxID=1491 RepID=UPI000A172F18|nr:glycosyltransferase family 2 protein [Clostridium botulinum]OSA79047.1 hypothetical protein B2H89_11190 [Clostridium botulinum]